MRGGSPELAPTPIPLQLCAVSCSGRSVAEQRSKRVHKGLRKVVSGHVVMADPLGKPDMATLLSDYCPRAYILLLTTQDSIIAPTTQSVPVYCDSNHNKSMKRTETYRLRSNLVQCG